MIAAACAALLFLVIWLPWFGVESVTVPNFAGGTTEIGGGTANAWNSFETFTFPPAIDFLMLLTIIVAIGLAVLTMTQRTVALPLSASVLVTFLGGLCALCVLYRILNQPGPNEVVEVKYGAYLGFLLCVGIAFGGWMSMRDEGASFGSAASRIQAGMAAAAATPQRPAPPPAPGPGPAAPPTPGQPFQPQQPATPQQQPPPHQQPAAPPPQQQPGVSSGDPLQPPGGAGQQPAPAQPGVPPHGTPPPAEPGGETRISPRPADAPPEGPPPGSSS
jgi:hypothetical protein